MAHPYIEKRFNIPYTYYQQQGHDGEDIQYADSTIIKGYGAENVQTIINYLGDKYESSSQLYFSGNNAIALGIRGGDYIENEFLGKVLVQGVRRYYARPARDEKQPRTELVVVYL